MALTVDGVPVSGSAGIVTHSRNRYGAYTRRRVKPVNPTSTRQIAARSAFTDAVAYWTAQNPTFWADWNNFAAIVPWTNKAGQAVNLTGQSMFIRYYAAYQAAFGVAPTLTGPPAVAAASPIAVSVTNIAISGADLEISFDAPFATNPWNVVAGRLFVEVTPGQNQSRRFPGSRWSSFGSYTVPTPHVATFDLASPIAGLRYGAPAGYYMYVRVRGIAPAAGGIFGAMSNQTILGPVQIN